MQEIADRCRVCRKTTDGEVFNVKLKFAAGVARIIEETVWHPSQEVERQSLLPVIAIPPEADAAIFTSRHCDSARGGCGNLITQRPREIATSPPEKAGDSSQ